MGKPRTYKTEEELEQVFERYIDYATKRHDLPNIAGFVVFADIGRQTFYDYKDVYPYTYKKINDILENATINARIGDSFKQFYMKNKFGYRDKQEIESENKNINMTYEEYLSKVDDKDAY